MLVNAVTFIIFVFSEQRKYDLGLFFGGGVLQNKRKSVKIYCFLTNVTA